MDRLLFHTLPPELNRMLQGYCQENVKVEYKTRGVLHITLPYNSGTETYKFDIKSSLLVDFLHDIKMNIRAKRYESTELYNEVRKINIKYYDTGRFSIETSRRIVHLDKHLSARVLEQLYEIFNINPNYD